VAPVADNADNADNQALRAAVAERDARIEMLEGKLETLALELARLKRQVVGPKSERRHEVETAQGSLFAAAEVASTPIPPAEPPPAARPAATPHGRRRPDGEPDEVIASKAPDSCAQCGGSLREISTSTATRVDWRRGHYYTVQVRRPSCACDRCRTVETAPEPAVFALPRSIAGNGLVARVIVDKFADNIPLNRQVDRFHREGLDLSLSTLCDLVRGAAGLLKRLVDAMRAEQLAGCWLQADDTGLPVLDGTKGQAGSGRLWVYANADHVVYDFTATKHGAGPAAFVKGFRGVLLADGGSEFNEAVRSMGLTRAGCWSHARRHFFDARDTSPALADDAIRRIGALFDIERAITSADLETRRRVRATDTRAALDDIKAWMVEHVHGARPRSPIGQAFQYALNQWSYLEVCATHPEIPIHNNMSELQLRRPVIGRKNWLFAGSEGGAQAAATLLSIVGSCRLHGLDPWEYLHTVLGILNDHPVNRIAELAPVHAARAPVIYE
jgi:transposase